MGGPGSGRRPTKPRRKGDILLGRDLQYHTVAKTQTGRQRRREAVSPRVEAAGVALVSGQAETVREAMDLVGYSQGGNGAGAERVRAYAVEVAEEQGLTLPKVMRTVADALDAKRAVNVGGVSIDEVHTDARLRAADLGLRVHGVGQADRGAGGGITVNVIQMIAPGPPERLIPVIDAVPTDSAQRVKQQGQ